MNHLGTIKRKPCWKKARESQKLGCSDELCNKLQGKHIPTCFTSCHAELRKSSTAELMLGILLYIEKSANIHIPKPGVNYFSTTGKMKLSQFITKNFVGKK